MLVTPSNLQAMFTGYNTRFNGILKASEPKYKAFAMDMASSGESNVYAFMARLARMREWLGERVIQNLASYRYELKNRTFEATFGVEREKIEDDMYGIYSQDVDALAAQVAMWPDDLCMTALQAGAGASAVTWDGVSFFNTAHPIDPNDSTKGTQSNLFATTPLTGANFDIVRAAMLNFKGEDLRPLNLIPRKVVVAPQLEIAARKIFVAPFDANGATNIYAGMAEVVVVPQLANEPLVWYLMDDTKPVKPLIFQTRRAPSFTSLTDLTTDTVFNKKTFIFGADARGNAGYGLYYLAARCTP